MEKIRNLFDTARALDRRIEKVISFGSDENEQLKREIGEYIVTDSIATSFERLLNHFDAGFGGSPNEIGAWVSGFYGSGKSSFTKYLGFSLDPSRKIDGQPFLGWLQAQLTSASLKAQLATVAKRYPAAVIMVDLASAQIAGATMAEISTVLYWTVMQWAGYSKDKKVAYLQFMLEKDGKMPAFKSRIPQLAKGKTWEQIQNQPLVVNQLASRLAHEFYPEVFTTEEAFQKLKIDEAERENERVADMLDLVRRHSGKEHVIFILDEVGQYIAARDNLILNLDGLAKNIKTIGAGKAWLIATAQQTLTEDDPSARHNSAKLFKLADRFPIRIDLEASDIREICYNRLLSKSQAGEKRLEGLFASHGAPLTHHTQLSGSRFYKSDLNKDDFRRLYPFLPQHFDILLSLLGQLAKTSGGIGLRSAIKVIQDVLVDQSGQGKRESLLADQSVGTLATAVTFYDTLRRDIQRSYKHVVEGVERTEKAFGPAAEETRVAKAVAVLQILEDFPISRENVAALLHPSVDAGSQIEAVKTAVSNLLQEPALHFSEVNGRLRFMSEAVAEIEKQKAAIDTPLRDLARTRNEKLKEIFSRQPEARLEGTRTVAAGVRVAIGSQTASLIGERDPIQIVIESVDPSIYDKLRDERIAVSADPANRSSVFWLTREDPGLESLVAEIVRCREIYNQNRNKQVEKEVGAYLDAQLQRAEALSTDLESRLRKMLSAGTFVFRSTPESVASHGENVNDAAGAQLKEVVGKVFSKYALAPIQAEGALAERFLKTPSLQQVASLNDPLGLVTTSAGQKRIDVDRPALLAIKDYLQKRGQVDGGRLLDDFYAPEFGWSKDTTRYLVAALLVAGVVKLRVSGSDVTVRGDIAIESLRNNNNFKKAGVALRDSIISPQAKLRAAQRVLDLTGDQVMPVEQEISQAVLRHFPEMQRSYASIPSQLKAAGLPGEQRAVDLQSALTGVLAADASDATPKLGSDPCPLMNDLIWARDVRLAFDNGLDQTVAELRRHVRDIADLPLVGVLRDLIASTVETRESATNHLARDDFYRHIPAIQTLLKQLKVAAEDGCRHLATEKERELAKLVSEIESMPEWLMLGGEFQEQFSSRLDALAITVEPGLDGIRKLLNQSLVAAGELAQIRLEITEIVAAQKEMPPVPPEPGGETGAATEVEIALPTEISSLAEIEQLLSALESVRARLAGGERIAIRWK